MATTDDGQTHVLYGTSVKVLTEPSKRTGASRTVATRARARRQEHLTRNDAVTMLWWTRVMLRRLTPPCGSTGAGGCSPGRKSIGSAAILDLVKPEIAQFVPPSPKTLDQTRSRSGDPLQRYGHLKFSKMAVSHHLGFGPTGSRSIRSADLEKPYPRTKHEVDRMTRCRDMAVRSFPKCEVGGSVRRSVVSPRYIHCSHTLLFVRNVAREE